MAKDYYEILDIKKGASDDEIHKAYLKLARKYHPDVNPGEDAKKKFQEVQQAFEVLKDPEKRKKYDRYGAAFESVGAGGGGGPRNYSWTGGAPEGFEDLDLSQIFGEQFGGGAAQGGGGFGDFFSQFRTAGKRRPSRTREQPASDLHHHISVPFTTAVSGGQVQLSVQRESGQTETLNVKIPAGIEDGQTIRLRGQGVKRGDGSAGDLLIRVQVLPHPHFRRRGRSLDVTLPVTVAEAVLGAKVDVPTPKGTVTVQVPPGTSSGSKLRIRGQGVAPQGKEPGDLFAEVTIVLPKNISDKACEAAREFDKQAQMDARRELKW